jgi:iron complex outermembrane recepter protein
MRMVLVIKAMANLKGGVPLNAPELKFGVAGTHDFDIGAWGATLASNCSWTEKTLFTNLADANNHNSIWLRPDYGVANASIGFTSPDEKYKVTIFVKSLFDKHYAAGLRRISGPVGGAGAVAQAIPRDFDRYFGANIIAKI